MLLEAINSAHDNCEPDCIHADACAGNTKALEEILQTATVNALEDGINPMVMALSMGIHIGYRLHEVAITPINMDKVN